MYARNLHYFTFVSRFVSAVTTDALAQELVRLRRNRLQQAVIPFQAAETSHEAAKAA
jgi:hypothetical protein